MSRKGGMRSGFLPAEREHIRYLYCDMRFGVKKIRRLLRSDDTTIRRAVNAMGLPRHATVTTGREFSAAEQASIKARLSSGEKLREIAREVHTDKDRLRRKMATW